MILVFRSLRILLSIFLRLFTQISFGLQISEDFPKRVRERRLHLIQFAKEVSTLLIIKALPYEMIERVWPGNTVFKTTEAIKFKKN